MAECLLQWIQLADRDRLLDPPATSLVVTADGGHLLVQAPMHFHTKLLALLDDGSGAFTADPRFASPLQAKENSEELSAMIREAFARKDIAEWLEILAAAGVPAMRASTMDEAMTSELVERRGATADIEIAGRGSQRVMLSAFLVNGERTRHAARPPLLGEHTRSVLSGLLGKGLSDLESLQAAGAFGELVV